MHASGAKMSSIARLGPTYRSDIDGLRAVAVLSVIAFHAFPVWLKGGFIGVDIFFVISGYLISGHIFESLENGTFSIRTFYAKRIRRIFPALSLVLLACLAFGWFALLTDEYEQLGKHIAAGAGFVSNLILWQEAGYFDTTAAVKPLLHLWSLGVEEQFYIVWPLIAWACWKLRLNLLVTILLLLGVSFALNTTYAIANPTLDFYSPLTRFWELLAGAALAQAERERVNAVGALTGNVQSVLGAGLLIFGLWFITAASVFPGWWAGLPVAGAVLLISAGPNALINRYLLSNRIAVAIGLISYPLYLWHWPLLSFAHIIESDMPARNTRVVLVALTFALAALTYFLVEKPLRFGRHRTAKVTALCTTMLALGLVGLWIFKHDGLPSRPMIRDQQAIQAQFVGPLWTYTQNDRCLRRYPFADAASYGWWFCNLSKDAPPTLLLLGNSFANQHYPGFASNPDLAQHSVLNIGTCPAQHVEKPAEGTEPEAKKPCSGNRWYAQQQFIDNIIATEKSVKFAIIDGLNSKPTEAYIKQLETRVDFLEAQGVKVILLTPHLRSEFEIKACFGRPFKKPTEPCTFSAAEVNEWREGFAPLVTQLQKSHPEVKIFDQNQLFCDGQKCSYIRDGMPLVRDQYDHLSEYASGRLTAMFVEWAKTNAPDILSP